MKIASLGIKNYRLLKNFSIDLEDELSLIVGKNNTGKTSLLTVMNKFLNGSDKTLFSFDDFNIDLKSQIKELVEGDEVDPKGFIPVGIKMKLLIKYNDTDNLGNLNRIMMDLDPDHYYVMLGFDYTMNHDYLLKLREDFEAFKIKEEVKKGINGNYIGKDIFHYLKNNLEEYFSSSRKSILCDKEGEVVLKEDAEETQKIEIIDLDREKISLKNIINFQYIRAERDISNKEIDKTLSLQTSKIYEKSEATDEQNEQIEKFKDTLGDSDAKLSLIYMDLFKDTIDKVSQFGGITKGDSEISIESTLQHRDLLKGNTTVMYAHGEHKFPEVYNGLGYMNLISIIFEIEIKLQEFKRTINDKPADINLLFIEEPEAHTHPQMQYVFINNIKNLLKEGIIRKDGSKKLQYIISTHSSHIVAESDFSDIRYLKRTGESSVIAKELKSLEAEYEEAGEEKNYRFLKQYLTLNKAELFFADKAILVEGDTERILLPAMMKKLDQELEENPLLSQNVSIVEVGAHSKVFEKFIDFIGLKKCLIITDIDSYYEKTIYEEDGVTPQRHNNGNEKIKSIPCPTTDPNCTNTANYSLSFFHNDHTEIEYFTDLSFGWKILRKNRLKKWVSNRKGYVLLAYQTLENGYGARSFEDSFFSINRDFIINPDNQFKSLTAKYLAKYIKGEIDEFEFAEKSIRSKPSFAIEILLNSEEDEAGNQFINWNIPSYIKEGLTWLKEN